MDICTDIGLSDKFVKKELSFQEYHQNGKSRGAAYLLFTTSEAAMEARKFFDGIAIHGVQPKTSFGPPHNPYRIVPKSGGINPVHGVDQIQHGSSMKPFPVNQIRPQIGMNMPMGGDQMMMPIMGTQIMDPMNSIITPMRPMGGSGFIGGQNQFVDADQQFIGQRGMMPQPQFQQSSYQNRGMFQGGYRGRGVSNGGPQYRQRGSFNQWRGDVRNPPGGAVLPPTLSSYQNPPRPNYSDEPDFDSPQHRLPPTQPQQTFRPPPGPQYRPPAPLHTRDSDDFIRPGPGSDTGSMHSRQRDFPDTLPHLESQPRPQIEPRRDPHPYDPRDRRPEPPPIDFRDQSKYHQPVPEPYRHSQPPPNDPYARAEKRKRPEDGPDDYYRDSNGLPPPPPPTDISENQSWRQDERPKRMAYDERRVPEYHPPPPPSSSQHHQGPPPPQNYPPSRYYAEPWERERELPRRDREYDERAPHGFRERDRPERDRRDRDRNDYRGDYQPHDLLPPPPPPQTREPRVVVKERSVSPPPRVSRSRNSSKDSVASATHRRRRKERRDKERLERRSSSARKDNERRGSRDSEVEPSAGQTDNRKRSVDSVTPLENVGSPTLVSPSDNQNVVEDAKDEDSEASVSDDEDASGDGAVKSIAGAAAKLEGREERRKKEGAKKEKRKKRRHRSREREYDEGRKTRSRSRDRRDRERRSSRR
ncbi:hypothetical protein HK096_006804 [Nowakowskiella sp. JEL0078]|nr:hypothetical protein HK096_006804 [Nowakowskiella sp. JEL0078]